jgi:hypothetical protein
MSKISQQDLLMEYFTNHAGRDIQHPEIVDWVVAEYKQRTGEVFRDPDRGIRKLAQQGILIKVKKGIYRYDPEHVSHRELEDFTSQQREEIFKRDGYRCVICGLGRSEGMEIHADHIKPKDLGGKAEIINGQTLCATHNFRKKNYKQTETGKKMFIRLYETAKALNDVETIEFCAQVLEVFERNHINGHIEWER